MFLGHRLKLLMSYVCWPPNCPRDYCPRRSATRSLALRAQGLRSSSDGSAQYRFPRKHFEPRFAAKRLFHSAVFQGMKTDHRQPPPRPQSSRAAAARRSPATSARRSPRSAGPGRSAWPGRSARPASAGTQRADQFGQLGGRLDRLRPRAARRSPGRSRRLYRSSP